MTDKITQALIDIGNVLADIAREKTWPEVEVTGYIEGVRPILEQLAKHKDIKHLGEPELAKLAFSVRTRLEIRFGRDRVAKFFRQDGEVGREFARQTFLIIRETLEEMNNGNSS